MTDKNASHHFGRTSEDAAVAYLQTQGYRILERNFRVKLGEIDIIAREAGTVCFIEVKARRTLAFGPPWEAVSKRKRRKMVQVAMCYLKSRNWEDVRSRFDVLAVTPSEQGTASIELIRNAFDLQDAGW